NPVIIDTPGHYFVAEGYDPTTDKFDFGTSATDLKGGSRWMSPAELNRTNIGAARAALFLDNPDPATGPSVAVTQPQARPPVVTEGAPAYQHAETDEGLAAQKYGLDPDIFFRQISPQSGGKATAVSPAGARGVGQFMPQTAAGVAQRMGGGVTAEQIMSDKAVGLDAAAFHMREMLDTYGGDYAKAWAAYNAGPGAAAKYGGVPPFKETQTYIQRILGDARPVAGAAPPPTTTPLEAPAPEAPAGPPGDWRPRAQASLDRLESTYGGLLPKPNIPQPPAGPTPDFASMARAQLDAGLAARAGAPPAAPRTTLPVSAPPPRPVVAPAAGPAAELIEGIPRPQLESYDQQFAGPTFGSTTAARAADLYPAVPARPTGDADLGIGLEPVPLRPTGDADLGIGLAPAYVPPPEMP